MSSLLVDLVEIILLHLRPDEPENLVRASLVCKSWHRILADPRFRRRYHDSHPTPDPVLGLLRNFGTNKPDFLPTSAFRPPAPDQPGWVAMDCRHGRALFTYSKHHWKNPLELLLWDPMKREQQRVPLPWKQQHRTVGFNAAVLCATQGCDHRSCQGGPFRIAIVFADERGHVTQACLYSSETGVWSQFTPLRHPDACDDYHNLPSLLVGDALYFSVTQGRNPIGLRLLGTIIECQLGTLTLSALKKPANNGRLMTTEDGRLGFAAMDGTSLTLWSRETDPETAVGWSQLRVIDLNILLPDCALFTNSWFQPAFVSGFAEGTQVIFVSSQVHLYMLDLKSGRVKKMPGYSLKVFPYTSFYIPDYGLVLLVAIESASTHQGQ
ncbi:unnamed protein product [Alopecurus aequalis]